VPAFKAVLFIAALVPVARLAIGAFFYPEWLGVNPAEYITRSTGDWALRFLLLTLSITPLRRVTGWASLISFRRMLGLFCFFYAVVHVSSYVSFDMVFDVGDILKDIAKRPFITVGFISLTLLLPLAVTSTNGMVRRLGSKRWLKLHRLIYAIGPLAVLHFWWMVKRDLTEPIIYAMILAVLLGYRLRVRAKDPRRRRAAAPALRPSPTRP
jgi:sulfoxide reductase heme-binding subunit YedZ